MRALRWAMLTYARNRNEASVAGRGDWEEWHQGIKEYLGDHVEFWILFWVRWEDTGLLQRE